MAERRKMKTIKFENNNQCEISFFNFLETIRNTSVGYNLVNIYHHVIIDLSNMSLIYRISLNFA